MIDIIVLIGIWLVCMAAVIVFVPRKQWRKAMMAYLACLAFTWLFAVIQAHMDVVSYPVREFPSATDLGIGTEFVLFPLLGMFYVLYEPETPPAGIFLYSMGCISLATLVDHVLATYTNLIHYPRNIWHWTWLLFAISFLTARWYVRWFFPGKRWEVKKGRAC